MALNPGTTTRRSEGQQAVRELESQLAVGCEVLLDLSPKSSTSSRHKSTVLGWESGSMLIFEMPVTRQFLALRRGQVCALRFLKDGEIWAFQSTIAQDIAHKGERALYIQWPSEITRVRVRKHERITLRIPCQVTLEGENPLAGAIMDLSVGGCGLILTRDLAIETEIVLSFNTSEGTHLEHCGAILRSKKVENKGTYRYGCQFLRLTESEVCSLELYVARQCAFERGEASPHPQVLIMTNHEEDAIRVQEALGPRGCETVIVSGILDLGHHLHTCNAIAVLVNATQAELPPEDICSIVKQTRGMDSILCAIYGGDEDTQKKSEAIGVEYLADLLLVDSLVPQLGL
jgi:c-di-GMP-binding flagellar brake protein YcgR